MTLPIILIFVFLFVCIGVPIACMCVALFRVSSIEVPPDGWYALSEREPDIDERVLLFAPGLKVFIGCLKCGYDYTGYDKNGKPFHTTVTHWQPLPDIPIEEEDDDEQDTGI